MVDERLGELTVEAAMHDSVPRHARGLSRPPATPHKLIVLGIDTADVISAAGGLVCDSIRAGLQVDVYLETLDDQRPLRILGTAANILPDAFAVDPEWPDAVYIAAALHERHRDVRRLATRATRRQADVAIWGATPPQGADPGGSTEHRLSSAARAFKLHAMKASGVAAQTAPVESFQSGSRWA
jgi:hypothetical protein